MGLLVAPAELAIGFAVPVFAHNKDAVDPQAVQRRRRSGYPCIETFKGTHDRDPKRIKSGPYAVRTVSRCLLSADAPASGGM